jgi:condensin complex subunit 1
MIASICATPRRYKVSSLALDFPAQSSSSQSPVLREAAILALTKLMCVSKEFCEAHLQLLFNLLEKSKDAVVRSNIVIALGDLAVCFGSLIDDVSPSHTERISASLIRRTPNGCIKASQTQTSPSRRTL